MLLSNNRRKICREEGGLGFISFVVVVMNMDYLVVVDFLVEYGRLVKKRVEKCGKNENVPPYREGISYNGTNFPMKEKPKKLINEDELCELSCE